MVEWRTQTSKGEGRRGKQLVTRQGKRERVEFNFRKGSRLTGRRETLARGGETKREPINGIAAQYIE